ncbi:ATP synthase subunit C [Thiohalomonas denitrificans]|uniref:V/A-type H+-transporting ATPase subunit K n=1 Tax=Thiohalomonas denitrificans TaxID=415747 RepID=A0A1G5PL87_9GAMM|nr:ATP synthase subunit C [Thiohalomonas denitrificans]SCZ50218.1 V/A-type H+-transporting ATPase subunit K [Thiohalomonas denitrificans]
MNRRYKTALGLIMVAGLFSLVGSLMLFVPDAVQAAETGTPPLPESVLRWAFMAAALATGLSSLAAGYAVATVGSAAMGALVEKPELLGRVLVLVGLAEGIAIYGLIISILILNRVT